MPYSILIDEWSDIFVKPHLGVVVMFYSRKLKKINSRFFGLAELESVDSDGIFNALVIMLKTFGLKYSHMIGYGSDEANVVAGAHNSVRTRVGHRNTK